MNIFVDYYFEKLKDMVNVNFLPDDFVAIFKKCSYYKIDVQGYCLMIGTENVFDFFNEYNYDAIMFSKKAFKVGEIGQYDLVYVYNDNDVQLYAAQHSRGYSHLEMTPINERLSKIIDNPQLLLKYIDFELYTYFNDADFQSLDHYLKNSDIPNEFYELFGKRSYFSKVICGDLFHFGSDSMNELLFKNVMNFSMPGYSLIVGEDEGEVNVLYLFGFDGRFKGVYGVHDDNLGDVDELIYLAHSLKDFINGVGHDTYLSIL